MSSPFLHKTIFFSESFSGDLMLCCYKIKFKKFLDVDMTIFGFCHHLGLFFPKNVEMTTLPTVRQPPQSATPPHWESSPMVVRAIPGPTRRWIARRLPNRIPIVFGLACRFLFNYGIGWQKMHKRVEAWKQKKIHINHMYTLHIFI